MIIQPYLNLLLRNNSFKIFKYILPLFFIWSLSSCKSVKTSSSSSAAGSNGNGLSEKDQIRFGAMFIDGCKERMKGNIEQAEVIFRECIKLDPSSSAVKYELGNIYRFSGMYDNALKYAKECANDEVKNQWYQLLYIECLHNKRQYSAAADVYSRLIKNYPDRPEFYEGLAAEYMYGANYEKSFKTYDEIEKKFGQNEVFTLNKIKLLKQLKRYSDAEIEFQKLIKMAPSEARYYTYLAEFYQETGQNDKAMSTYQDVLKIDPSNPMVHLALADYYKSQNNKEKFNEEVKIAFENPDLDVNTKLKILVSYYQYTEQFPEYLPQAYELCNIMIKTHPSSPEGFSIYADYLYRDKKTKEAAENYGKAAKLDKGSFAIWKQLMFLQSDLNQFDSLYSSSHEALELFPNQAIPYYFNGVAAIQLDKYKEATEVLNEGIEFVYDNNLLLIQFYSNLGLAYHTLKDYEKSDKAYENALKVDPDNADVLNNYSYYLSLRKQHLEKAEKYSKRSNELVPNNRSYIDTYGWILFQLGKYKDAEEWLARAAKMGPKSTVILEHYGDVLYKLNKTDEAVEYWIKAKQAGKGSDVLEKKITDRKYYE